MSGYEAVRIYGENTLELKGMPLGKTPEYVQAPEGTDFLCDKRSPTRRVLWISWGGF